jgi:hypothetical protein
MQEYKLKCRNAQQGIVTAPPQNHIQHNEVIQQHQQQLSIPNVNHGSDEDDDDEDGEGED